MDDTVRPSETAWATAQTSWGDKTAGEILDEIRAMEKMVMRMKLEVLGVTVVAGASAYAAIRPLIPEDDELVRVVETSLLAPNECYVVKNEFLYGRWPE